MKVEDPPKVKTLTEAEKAAANAEVNSRDAQQAAMQAALAGGIGEGEPSPYRESLESDEREQIAEAREKLGIDALEVRIAELEKNQAKFRR